MPSFLSAKAPTFSPRTQPSASNTEMPLIIACRENEEIGVYKDGVLKPRKDVRSLIAWKEDTPFTTVAASAKDAQLTTVTPVPSASLDEVAVFQSASPMAGPDAIGVSPNTTADGNSLKFHQGEVPTFGMVQPNAPVNHNYQPLSPQFQNFQQQILTNHQPAYYPATGLFQYPAYQLQLPSDIAVVEANRPVWNPAYHKVISPSVERANQVVEEFKLYFGDGRVPELLLLNLQKICVLCGLSDTNSLPESSEGCITVRSDLPILASMFPVANPHLSNRSWRKSTSMYSILSKPVVQLSKAVVRESRFQPSERPRNSLIIASKKARSAPGGLGRRIPCSRA